MLALENVMEEHSLSYEERLFKAEILINEYEIDGTNYSNREKNAILDICKENPDMEKFLVLPKSVFNEKLSITNFSEDDYSQT